MLETEMTAPPTHDCPLLSLAIPNDVHCPAIKKKEANFILHSSLFSLAMSASLTISSLVYVVEPSPVLYSKEANLSWRTVINRVHLSYRT